MKNFSGNSIILSRDVFTHLISSATFHLGTIMQSDWADGHGSCLGLHEPQSNTRPAAILDWQNSMETKGREFGPVP